MNNLKTAEEIASVTPGVSAERLIELAEAGYAPHYIVDNNGVFFKSREIKDWIFENLIQKKEGKIIGQIRVVCAAAKPTEKPPLSIQNIEQLQQIPPHDYQPGVYFLCENDEVVYVGQSVAPSARVAAHRFQGKKSFDRAYLLPVPQSELNDVEARMIKLLEPKLNGRLSNGKLVCPVGGET